MKAINKKVFIADLYQRTESILAKAIKQYQNLDEVSLNFSLDKENWSIAQVLSHLNSYGNYYLPKMETFLEKSDSVSEDTYIPGWLGNYFVNMMDVGKSKKRYKAAKQHLPLPHIKDAYAEVAEFIAQQERMLKYLKAFEKADFSKKRIPISINKLIKLKLGDVLSFMVTHNERHVEQIKKIQRTQTEMLSQRTIFTTLAP